MIPSIAYERTSRYNVFLVDYSSLNRPPCYVSAVNNLRYVSRCVGNYLNRFQTNGLNVDKLTCTGHSLGAIVCGLLRNHLQFQLQKIIGNFNDTQMLLRQFGGLKKLSAWKRGIHFYTNLSCLLILMYQFETYDSIYCFISGHRHGNHQEPD